MVAQTEMKMMKMSVPKQPRKEDEEWAKKKKNNTYPSDVIYWNALVLHHLDHSKMSESFSSTTTEHKPNRRSKNSTRQPPQPSLDVVCQNSTLGVGIKSQMEVAATP
jgi:hypothetical protein